VTSIASMISCRPANGLKEFYQPVNSPSNSVESEGTYAVVI
jgi:hypothetical protein